MQLRRELYNLDEHLFENMVLLIYGPRKSGKTDLITDYLSGLSCRYRSESGDNITIHEILGSKDKKKILDFAESFKLIVIDDAQKIKNIGTGLKILADNMPGIKIIAAGSSAFEAAGRIKEPLIGRKVTITLLPVGVIELFHILGPEQILERLEEFLVYGMYPEIITIEDKDSKIRKLSEITNSYLLKDLIEIEKVQNTKIILEILRFLSFNIGSVISVNSIAKDLKIDAKTVARYLKLLEKTFVIYCLHGYSRNLREEITRKHKYYFYDNGLRNALISNFNSLNIRNDTEMLWENFLFTERLKTRTCRGISAKPYFWKTWECHSLDLIEERDGKLYAFEFKWEEKKLKGVRKFFEVYPDSELNIISKGNFYEFLI
jgi:uncharacterized protein